MKKIIFQLAVCAIIYSAGILSGCSDKSISKEESIRIYNEFAFSAPPALGEGEYPLTANFSAEDKGKEAKAEALVNIGFLRPELKGDNTTGTPASFTDRTVTFHLTDLGRKYYNGNMYGFAWGRHSAFSASNIKTATASGQKIAYVTLKTKIIEIPDWAKQKLIVDNYPLVKEGLDSREYTINAVFKFTGNRWTLSEANQAAP